MAVRFDTSDYRRSYCHKPKGRGGWYFTKTDPRKSNHMEDAICICGTYTEARKGAALFARANGIDTMFVLS
ncbi:MAG: hypothetical protein ABSH28_01755 [Acidobacteriota bacterium]